MASLTEKTRNLSPIPLIIGAVVALVLIFVFGRFCSSAATINVTINGTQLSLHGAKTMETAIRESGLPINPGDLISLNGNVLKKSAGYPFAATVNGEETADPDLQLHNGDTIVVTDGNDKIEDYDATESAYPHSGTILGLGAICAITPGVDGVLEHRTGRISGEEADHITVLPTKTECVWYNPNVGDDKVIALTFDDGPSKEYTATLLDVLRENNAKATFFCMGNKVADNAELVKRERDEGHQVCSGTYSRSWTSILTGGAESESVTAEQLRTELEKGQQAIRDALGGDDPSRCASLPVVRLTGDLAAAVDTLIDAAISWNVDSGDRIEYNTEQIFDTLINVEPGEVVLLHDGGGNRAATIQALRSALPKLKAAGYSFITIDELRRYPAS